MAVTTVRQQLRSLNLSARQLKDMTRDAGSEWSDDLVNDYLTNFQNFVTLSEGADDLEPLTGEGNPETDAITANKSHVFYRIYLTGNIRVTEIWYNAEVGATTGWHVASSYSELESL